MFEHENHYGFVITLERTVFKQADGRPVDLDVFHFQRSPSGKVAVRNFISRLHSKHVYAPYLLRLSNVLCRPSGRRGSDVIGRCFMFFISEKTIQFKY